MRVMKTCITENPQKSTPDASFEETYNHTTLGESHYLGFPWVCWHIQKDKLLYLCVLEIAKAARVMEHTKGNVVSIVGRFLDTSDHSLQVTFVGNTSSGTKLYLICCNKSG